MRTWVLLALLLAWPVAAQTPPRGRAAELEALAAGLKAATSEETAAKIEGRMRELWVQGVSPTGQLLLRRAMRELSASPQEALDDIEQALVLDPDAPEAYLRRALARFQLGDYRGAVTDVRETLNREPRHVAALQSLSRFAEALEDWTGALAAWKQVLELSPKTPDGEERLKMLTRKALGDDA